MPRGTRWGFRRHSLNQKQKVRPVQMHGPDFLGRKGRFRFPTQTADAGVARGPGSVEGGVEILVAAPRRRKVHSARDTLAGIPRCAPCASAPDATRCAGLAPGSGSVGGSVQIFIPPQIMLRRSSSPTSSIWCFLSWARLELKKVRPFLFSAIHLRRRCRPECRRARAHAGLGLLVGDDTGTGDILPYSQRCRRWSSSWPPRRPC